MGKAYVQHSDMCGCERCALQYERENPSPVFDEVEDPDILNCGCSVFNGCSCWDDPYDDTALAEFPSLLPQHAESPELRLIGVFNRATSVDEQGNWTFVRNRLLKDQNGRLSEQPVTPEHSK